MKKIFILLCVIISCSILILGCSKNDNKSSEINEKGGSSLESIVGNWEGSINIPNQPLPFLIQFSSEGGTISIPIQGLNHYPLASVKLTEQSLFFDMKIQGQQITFDGKVDNDKITGTFSQQGQSFPFELTKTNEQEPEEDGETVQIELQDGTMKATLEMPQGEGPFPIMIIIAGSGPTDKDGNSPLLPGKNNSLKMVALDLAAHGVASIRYDKRGVGANASLLEKEEDVSFEHFINDAASWVQFAKEDKRFSKVGIIGHSEGSLIGMAAANKGGADAFVSIAGAGRPIDEVLLEQLKVQLPTNLLEESKTILEKLKKGEQVQTVSAEIQNLFRPSVQPYMISWLKINPQEQIQKLDCPVLIMNGNQDIQVPVTDAEALYAVKKDANFFVIEGMNHVLKEAPEDREGNLATYSKPDLPLAKGLMDNIIEFLKENDFLASRKE
ncbi:alpha/beta hydrolase [Bacillus sp. Bva_UNVM-123]